MDIDTKLEFVHSVLIKHNQEIIQAKKPRPLNKLKMSVLRSALLNEGSYQTIADSYNYTEGHVKKVAYELWKDLSEIWGIKVSRDNLLSVIETELQTQHKNLPLSPPIILHHKAHDFIGRDTAITDINNLVNEGRKIIVIQAPGGVGKTRLAQEYIKSKNFDIVIPLLMAKEKENISTVESVSEDWLKNYFQEEPGTEFGVNLQKLRRQLQTQKVGILIDNLEPALDKQGRFIEKHRGYIEILRVLSDATVQSVTLITSREPVYENLETETYLLPSLNQPDWKEFFASHNINAHEQTLSEIHKAYGGNALAMKVLYDPIIRYYDQNIESYWCEHKISGDLLVELAVQNLIKEQFNRLQKLDYVVYKLLCRLGCYRYQDISKVPIEALLCLLWDISDEKQRRYVINSLRSRCLVEFEKGEYWLHPIIREEAIEHLKLSDEWQEVNLRIGQFWTESVKNIGIGKDALRAFEAYYHYINIDEFILANQVIMKVRDNTWRRNEPLNASFCRLGLLQKMIPAINKILENINNQYSRGQLYSILTSLYFLSGQPQKSVSCNDELKKIVNKYDFQDLKILSLHHTGLYQIDYLELESAKQSFNDTAITAANTNLHRYAVTSLCALSFLKSTSELEQDRNEAELLIASNYTEVVNGNILTPFGKGYGLVFLGLSSKNLGNYQKSDELYRKAILHAGNTKFTQVKGKAISGLAELYRIQDDFETALSHHLESIEILDKIGAKCDLAEAYYQLGLTYQKMGELKKSHTNFNEAIRLFNEMEAPKQVEKVEKAIRGNID